VQYQPFLRIAKKVPTAMRFLRHAQASIVATTPINLDAGITRVTKHITERRVVRSIPTDVTLLRPALYAIGKRNVMIHEIMKNATDRPALFE
jgi:hypothetical protein